MKNLTTGALSVCLFLTLSANVLADSAFFTANPPYQAQDVNIPQSFSSFDVNGNDVYGWQGGGGGTGGNLFLADLDGSSVAYGGGTDRPTAYIDTAFNSFTAYVPGTNTLWLGFTVIGNTDDRIYSLDLNTNTWSSTFTTLAGNYALKFNDGKTYASATGGASDNGIFLVDTSGADSHQLLATVGGFSAGFDFDGAGDLYYASADVVSFDPFDLDGELFRYTAAQIAAAEGGSALTRGDAEQLASMVDGSSSLVIDDGDNVYFTITGSTSELVKWNGVTGAGANYEVVGNAVPLFPNNLVAQGDLDNGGDVFVNIAGFSGIVQIPEPASGSLLLLAGLGALALRRRSDG